MKKAAFTISAFFLGLLSSFAAPPVISDLEINEGGTQRSMITAIRIVFDQNISASIQAGDLTILPEADTTIVKASSVSWNEDENIAIWTFPNEKGGSLPAGNFSLTLSAAGISNSDGETLDGDNDGNEGGNYSFDLFRHFGDLDGDRDVDFLDTAKFRESLNTSKGDAEFNTALDFDGDDDVDDDDLAEFQKNYLTYLPIIPSTPVLDNVIGNTDQNRLTLTGTAPPGSKIRIVNGDETTEITTGPDGRFTANIPLNPNRVNAIAVSSVGVGNGASPVVPVTITQDSQPPFLSILYPEEGAVITQPETDLFGDVGDTLSGFDGLTVMVRVNEGDQISANIDQEIGANGRYDLSGITLQMGANKIEVIAQDKNGNTTTRQVNFTMGNPGGNGRLQIVSGDRQTGVRNEQLPSPLIVKVIDAAGQPVRDTLVTFEVAQSDGSIVSDNDLNPSNRCVQVVTDTQGNASVQLSLGSDAGTLNNWVQVRSELVMDQITFRASADPNPPTQIVVATGNDQRGETGATAGSPLRVWLSDGLNGVPNHVVRFQVKKGGGSVNSIPFVDVTTDSTGHALVNFDFGPNGGTNVIEANFDENLGEPAIFSLVGVQRFVQQPTTFVGIVLDNANLPIGGATVTLESGGSVSLPALSSEDGIFRIPNAAPGSATLRVAGENATTLNGEAIDLTGRYPHLAYITTVVPNAENRLPVPVLLPSLNPANARTFDNSSDLEITVEGVAGVRFKIKADSVTLADGTVPSPENPVQLSLNQVHIDNLPMPLPDGTASLFAWTLQPAGMHLDPPAEVELPNMNASRPGSLSNILSFNHDTESFEIVSRARVSEDGSTIFTRAGEGIPISGWGGSCPPYAVTGDVTGLGTDSGAFGDVEVDTDDLTVDCNQEQLAPTKVADPVIVGTGELTIESTDLEIPGRGLHFMWTRTYRSQFDYNGPMGQNWDHNYNRRLLIPEAADDDQSIILVNGEARVDRYPFNPATGRYDSAAGFFDVLRKNPDGTFTIRSKKGFKTHFDANGRMTSQEDRNGNQMRFAYNAADQLSSVIDPLGRRVEIIYNEARRIEQIRDWLGRECVYTYNGFGQLVAARSPAVTGTTSGNDFPNGKTTRYAYLSGYEGNLTPLNHNLVSITDPKNQEYVFNRFESDPASFEFDRVVRQRWGNNTQVIDFSYRELNSDQPDAAATPKVETTMIDRNGNRHLYLSNGAARILEHQIFTNRSINPDDPASFITRHSYNNDGVLISTTDPEGNSTSYVYDSGNSDRFQQRNLLQIVRDSGPRGGDQATLTTSFTYEPIYNQLRSTTEARGNDATYTPQNGGGNSSARYTKTCFFDYQEGNNIDALAAETGRPQAQLTADLAAAGVQLGLGDLNGDGTTNISSGNLVRCQHPNVRLIDGSNQEILEEFVYNQFGQLTKQIDPEGNVDQLLYHPESDPDGDGTPTPGGGLNAITGGYLAATIQDAELNPRRNQVLPLAQIRTDRFYDSVGNLIRSIDGRRNETSFEVNALNQVVRRTSEAPFFYDRTFRFDANDNIVREDIENVATNGPGLDPTDNQFVSTTFEYDILNHRTAKHEEVSDSESLTTLYAYDRNQNLENVTQPEGNIVATVYDERDLVYSVTRGLGSSVESTTTTTYDGNRNPVKITDSEDNNGDGLPESTLASYDGFDRRTSVLDAEGNRTNYTIDPAGNIVSEAKFGPNGGASRLSNAEDGNVLLSQTDCQFDELSRRYQCDDRLFSNIAPVGPEGALSPADGFVTNQFHFDRNGRLLRGLDDNANPATYSWDGLDRRLTEVDAIGNSISYTYDNNHNAETVTETDISPEGTVPNETFVTTFRYDSLDRRIMVIDNLGNETAFGYDSRNNRILTTDALGNTTTETYDGLNRQLATIRDLRVGGTGSGNIDTSNAENPDGQITRLASWDGNSRLVSETDDKGNSTNYGYDALNRRVTETFADSTRKIFTHDRDSNLTTYTDQNGSVCTHTHDGLNRLVQKDVTRATGIAGFTRQTFQYDGLSRRTLATDNNDPNTVADDSSVAFQYDSLSRVLTEVQNGETVSSRFDGVGRKLSGTYPDGRVITQTHDTNNRTKSIRDQGSAVNIAEYDYLGQNRVLERRYANGTTRTHHDGAGNQHGYDGVRRELARRHLDSRGTLLAGFSYAYDQVHNRRYERDLQSGTADVYQYDSSYRVTRAGYDAPAASISSIQNNATTNSDVAGLGVNDQKWTLDGVGNWAQRSDSGTPTTYAANVMNEYEAVGDTPITHDRNGNLSGDGDLTYFHDHLNRLVRIERGGNLVAAYSYDAVGRRIGKALPAGSGVRFFHDGAHCIEERDIAGSTLRQYVYGIRIDEPLELKVGAIRYYYHCNSIGSIKALTDSTGSIVESYDYTAYGETTIFDSTGAQLVTSSLANPYTFTGRRLDSESGLHYYRARYYSATLGRFIERDPLGYVDGMGLYTYTGNNPLNRVDPSGELWSFITTAAFAAADTIQYATGSISGSEYAGRMALNGAALAADFATGGMGGGLALRSFAAANRIAKAAKAVANTRAGQRIAQGVRAYDRFSSGVDIAVGASDVYRGLSADCNGKRNWAQASAGALRALGGGASLRSGVIGSTTTVAQRTTPNAIGQAGENAVSAVFDIGRKQKILVNGRNRIPDGITDTVLSEIKNVKSLSYTRQLRDFADIAAQRGLQYDLYVRPSTQLTGPLQKAVQNGIINLKFIPGVK